MVQKWKKKKEQSYLSRAISMQGEKGGKWKYGINSVIGIFITQFRVFDSEDVLSEMKLIDPKTNKTAS